MQACAGLHAAHELRDGKGQLVGLVHRDVSPQNLIVTYDGVTKVVDFGVAKATAVGGGATGAGQIKGKVGYMAPEQIEGESIDRRVDIFAMGIVLYALTTGKHPFRRESDAATMYNICSPQAALAPRKFIPDYPEALENVLMKSLAKSAADRYPSANDMLRDLDHALPSSERANTDQDVAEFIRRLVGERLEERRNTLSEALLRADQSAIQRIPDVPNPGSISVTSAETSALTRPATHPFLARRRLYLALGSLILVGAAGAGLALVSGDPPPPVTPRRVAQPTPPPVIAPETPAAAATTEVATSSEPTTTVIEPPPPAARQTSRPSQRSTSRSGTPAPSKKPPPPTSWKHDPGF
jgi:serine/threonine-protein kinase